MGLSTKIYVEHPDLALVETIRSVPDVDLGVVSDAGTDPDHGVHWFWVEAEDFDAFEAALAADHTVASFSTVAGNGERRTYQIEYSDAATLVSPVVTDAGGLVLESRSRGDGWELVLQLADRNAIEELDAFARETDLRLEVLEIREAEESDIDTAFGLTEPQIEALVNAYLHGYYDEPRGAVLADLADLLDISETAVSGRLRRGSAALIDATLLDSEE
jgi:predicted DNA binding protein